MSDLRPNLFDTDYDRLVTLGRSLIPKYAPAWTDHNIHDPGIMLLELLAWTAEAQTYSLARLRQDERWAYGALLGFERSGPLPARGLIWPNSGLPQQDTMLDAGIPVLAEQAGIPVFRLRQTVSLTTAKLVAVNSRLHDDTRLDHTAANAHLGASFFPFGTEAAPGDRLVLTLEGSLPPVDPERGTRGLLSLGVRVPPALSVNACSTGARPEAESEMTPDNASRLSVALVVGAERHELGVALDETDGFLHAGIILLDLGGVADLDSKRFAIEFESQGSGLFRPPQILCLGLNVLPVEQSERKEMIRSFEDAYGLPDLRIPLEDPTVRWRNERPDLSVTVDAKDWRYMADLSRAGPAEEYFAFDRETRQVRFGNGLNGRLVPSRSRIRIVYDVTEGAQGNLPAGLTWTIPGVSAGFGRNEDPMTGGAAELDLLDLRRLARESVRTLHAVVTQADLEQAALSLCDLQVARAQALPLPDRGSRCLALPYQRTLVVLRTRTPGLAETESPQWLAEIRRLLASRLLLGETLRVVAPEYGGLAIRTVLTVWPGLDPDDVRKRALAKLEGFFALIAAPGTSDAVWPMGRGVEPLDVKARLRCVEGVRAVTDCALEWLTPGGTTPVFSPRFLPLWDRDRSQVLVVRTAPGG